MTSRTVRNVVCAAAVAGALLAAPAAAGAAVNYSVTAPSALTLPGPQTVNYTLHFENEGAATEFVSLRTTEPELAPPKQGLTMGRADRVPALTSLVGTTAITGMTFVNVSFRIDLFCLRSTYGISRRDLQLAIPAGASGTVGYEFLVGAFPPRLGESYAPKFLATSGGVTQEISASEPVLLGQKGTDIFVGAWVKKKRRLVLTGSTSPAIPAGQVIDLQMTGPGANTKGVVQTPLGTAPVDAAGAFIAERKLPRRAGMYSIDAFYRSQSADLAGDSACASSILLPARPKGKKKGKKAKR